MIFIVMAIFLVFGLMALAGIFYQSHYYEGLIKREAEESYTEGDWI